MGKRYPLKAVRTLEKKKRRSGKSRKLFPSDRTYFVLGASLAYKKPPDRGRINQRRDSSKRIEPGKPSRKIRYRLAAKKLKLNR